ncbi:MAG: putative binding-protein-dependent transport system inner rane component [Rhodospirillales bacterium]|nr:putative binding-protein-dependent transport system inner rane component [Rhodospirillales bacterium]
MSRFLPLLVGAIVLAFWEVFVRVLQVPKFVLPPPSLIADALVANLPQLLDALRQTLEMTLAAFAASFIGGLALAILFVQSRLIERSLLPYAVVLQVTPIVAIAPLIVIWVGVDHVERAVFILATIVAFFPILSNASFGLRSVDPGLADLFRLYRATGWQRLWLLQLPSALPALLAGARISAGLALIGAVVAEFVAGSGEATGLAWRIVESGNRLEIPRMFAALLLLSLTGLALNAAIAGIEHRLLRRWHVSHGESS